jgi:diaminohydroxyphosphoribosylaminopyrimidine deaminase / 5-amino-6-(5-phosphoribosylamino)uracil reductase
MHQHDIDLWHLRRALELAARGQGSVEPNPMVGCVIARGAEIIGEGWHRRFGQAHAEIEALGMAGPRAAGATLYVTLEPCCHRGKTPPCTHALLDAGVRRAVVAQTDPFPEVQGRGVAALRAAGVEVEVGLLEADARRLNAPYLKLVETGRPWIIVKWAMTLDGKLAAGSGDSRWISGEASRAIVHQLRGRVDAILVGRGTVERDDPLLTARPPGDCPNFRASENGTVPFTPPFTPNFRASENGTVPFTPNFRASENGTVPFTAPRTAVRVVLDTHGSLGGDSQLVRTANGAPVLVAVGEASTGENRARLREAGCEVFVCPGPTHDARLDALLAEFGRRRWTNVLVEGGGRVFGSLFDLGAIDEVHVFIAPKLVGGASAAVPTAGRGVAEMSAALRLEPPHVQRLGDDVYLTARCSTDSWRGSRAGRASCSTDT